MEDDTKKVEEALKPDVEPEKFLAKMEIVMLLNGNIGIRGPTGNKPLCKGLLAAASQLIDDIKSEIMIPRVNIVPGGKNIGRG